jgi:hypothetical protein
VVNVAFAVGLLAAVPAAHRAGVPARVLLDAAPIVAVAAVTGARAWYVAWHWADYAADWQSTLYLWEGGLSLEGAIIGGLLGTALAARLERVAAGRLCDAGAPAAALAIATGQAGCLLLGCSGGPGQASAAPPRALLGPVPLEAVIAAAMALLGITLLLRRISSTTAFFLTGYGVICAAGAAAHAGAVGESPVAASFPGLAFCAAGLLWLGLARWRSRTAARG